MFYTLVPIILLSLLTGAKADFVRDRAFFPRNSSPITAEKIGLPKIDPDPVTSFDGAELIGFHVPPKDEGRPLILYFHGQGGFRDGHFKELVGHGYGVMAYAYRGYHGSQGAPNERDILRDADAIYDKARATYPPERIVVMGESIGTGVATILASRHEEAALVLDSPYDNTPMVVWSRYSIPVFLSDLFIEDRFHADKAIGKVKAPVLISVGCRDDSIPHERGEALYLLANHPKKLIAGYCEGHIPLSKAGEMLTKANAWIDRPVDGGEPEQCPNPQPMCRKQE